MVKGLKEVHVYLDDEKNLRLLSLAKQENISKKELLMSTWLEKSLTRLHQTLLRQLIS